MTQFQDQIRQGEAYYVRASLWNGGSNTSGFPAPSVNALQVQGAMHTQTVVYQVQGLPTVGASTALASGIFFSASGSATTGAAALTATGPLVTASVATFDVPRGVRITASVNLSTTTFQVVGTDGYGAGQTHQFIGPTGDTIGNNGSFTDSLVTFKTVTAVTIVNTTASGVATTALMVGTNNCFGLPYRISNTGKGLGVYINGSSATVPATWVAGFTATGTPTASTTDVRGTVTLATVVLANDSRFITLEFIAPAVGVAENFDTKENTYGAAPFGS